MLLKLLWHQGLQTSKLDLIVQLIIHLIIVARHEGLPAFNSRLEFRKRASSRRNDSTKKASLPSACCRTIPLLQSSPRFQGFLPRVGINTLRFAPREGHKRCMHLLQSELQVLYSSFLVRHDRQNFPIRSTLSRFPSPVQQPTTTSFRTPLSLQRRMPSLLRPLLEVLFLAREFLPTSSFMRFDETRSILPSFGCGQIVDHLYCCCNLDSCSNLSFESEQLLLQLNHRLLHRNRHRSSSRCGSTSAPPAFHRTHCTPRAQTVSSVALPKHRYHDEIL